MLHHLKIYCSIEKILESIFDIQNIEEICKLLDKKINKSQ